MEKAFAGLDAILRGTTGGPELKAEEAVPLEIAIQRGLVDASQAQTLEKFAAAGGGLAWLFG
ncbi:hypothetical protein ACN28S_23890 [Cystobacter fuscus]